MLGLYGSRCSRPPGDRAARVVEPSAHVVLRLPFGPRDVGLAGVGEGTGERALPTPRGLTTAEAESEH